MRRIISNTGKALHSIVSEHLRQHTSVHNIPALVTPPPVARWGDDKVYHDQAARVKVHFNVSTPCIYDMLMGQEQYLSTVDNNLVQEAAQQHQSVPHLSLSSNWGMTTRTAAGVRRHEGKEADDKRPGISTEETCGAIRYGEVQHHQSAGATVHGTGPYRRHGTSWRHHQAVSTIWGSVFPPECFAKLALHGQTPDDLKAVRRERNGD